MALKKKNKNVMGELSTAGTHILSAPLFGIEKQITSDL